MMRYCPVESVTTERTFSINAGLDASTVTPGRTAPEESFTTPVIEACAKAIEDIVTRTMTIAPIRIDGSVAVIIVRISSKRWLLSSSARRESRHLAYLTKGRVRWTVLPWARFASARLE